MNNAVITLAVGQNGQEMHAITAPSQKAYAERIGATYAVIADATMKYPMGEKWRLSKLATPFDRIVYLDADVVVRPEACSLFDVVPVGEVGLYDDLPDMDGSDWFHSEVEQLRREQGMEPRKLGHCYNTGIVVFDREHCGIFAPPTKPFTPLFCAEQHLINVRVAEAGYPVHRLPRSVHWQWWSDKERRHLLEGQFVHFSGLRDHALRLEELRKAAAFGNKNVPASSGNKKPCACGSAEKRRQLLA